MLYALPPTLTRSALAGAQNAANEANETMPFPARLALLLFLPTSELHLEEC